MLMGWHFSFISQHIDAEQLLYFKKKKKPSCGKVTQKPANVNMLFLWAWGAVTHCSVGSP